MTYYWLGLVDIHHKVLRRCDVRLQKMIIYNKVRTLPCKVRQLNVGTTRRTRLVSCSERSISTKAFSVVTLLLASMQDENR